MLVDMRFLVRRAGVVGPVRVMRSIERGYSWSLDDRICVLLGIYLANDNEVLDQIVLHTV